MKCRVCAAGNGIDPSVFLVMDEYAVLIASCVTHNDTVTDGL